MGLLDAFAGDALAKLQDLMGKQEGGQLSHDDTHDLHEQLAGQATPEQYNSAAHDAISQLSPEQQQELHGHLSSQLQAQGHDPSVLSGDHEAASPGGMAGMLTQLQHGGLGGVMNMLGGAGGLLKNPLISMVIGAIGGQMARKMR